MTGTVRGMEDAAASRWVGPAGSVAMLDFFRRRMPAGAALGTEVDDEAEPLWVCCGWDWYRTESSGAAIWRSSVGRRAA